MAKNRDVLVVGGGIAGMQTALLLAEKNRRVYVMEKAPAIGGYFPLLDRQFPTNSCGVCFMSPRPPALCPIYEGQFHEKIELVTNSDLLAVTGEAGNFEVAYTARPTFVDPAKCTLCRKCTEVCPVSAASEFGEGVETRKAIYLPFPQAIPRSYVIDPKTCTQCGQCVTACQPGAIDLKEPERAGVLNVGAIVLGFGFEPFQAKAKGEFGFGRYPNVLSSIQYERMLSYSSPTNGIPTRPSDGQKIRRVAFIECVGSRDQTCGNPYCSSVCCMFTAKQAMLSKQRIPDFEATVFYMDVRAFGKDYERYYENAQKDYGVRYLRCAVSMIHEQKQTRNLLITYGNEEGQVKQEEFNLVVLATGLNAPASIKELAAKIGVDLNEYNFCRTHEFQPTCTSKAGVFVAGAFREPRDIPESVVEACSAAADVAALLDDFGNRSAAAVPAGVVDEAGLRIGVFICEQKNLLADGLDLDGLLAEIRNEPNVRFVTKIDVTSSAQGVAAIMAQVNASDINRIILAGYRGLELERRLKQAGTAGLYANYVEVVNIGEQCVDVHRAHKAIALKKAAALVKTAIRKTWEVNPVKRRVRELGAGVLVVGGGIAGMTSSLALAAQGIAVTLVEKEKELGGLANTAYYTVKGSSIQPWLLKMIADVAQHPKITVLKAAELKKLEGSWGNFTATVGSTSLTTGGSTSLTTGGSTSLTTGGSTSLTTGAQPGREQKIAHGALILATGGHEHKPAEYLYGEHPHVMTQRELDAMIVRPEATNERLKIERLNAVVMIQCVGSRDEQHPYCSRVCCTHAVKNALKLKELNSHLDIYILYRDVRTYGFFEKYYLQAREQGVIFIRYETDDKPKVAAVGKNLRVSWYDRVAKEQITVQPDLLILSAGVEPNDLTKLAETVQVQVNADGFFAEANPKAAPLDARDRGKFFAGLAHSPMLIEEAICQGKAAAERAAVMLWQGREVLPETQSVVKEQVCTGCGQCVQVCPYNAIALHPQSGIAVVDEALCRGCGTCAGTCRVQAIDIKTYGDLTLLHGLSPVLGRAQNSIVDSPPGRCPEPVEGRGQGWVNSNGAAWEPAITAFICSWCAAGAADLAGDSQLQYGAGVRLVKVPCVARINPLYIIKTLQQGADGVLVTGCHPKDCHFISGNLVQRRTFGVIKKYLAYLGLDENRVQFAWVSASEGTRFAALMQKLVNDVKQLGPQTQLVKEVHG